MVVDEDVVRDMRVIRDFGKLFWFGVFSLQNEFPRVETPDTGVGDHGDTKVGVLPQEVFYVPLLDETTSVRGLTFFTRLVAILGLVKS